MYIGHAVSYSDQATLQQDHTSQDHFCSVIDEFPVWNSEPDQPTMMSWAAGPEREEVPELSRDPAHWWSLIFLSQEDGGTWCCMSGFYGGIT